MPPSDKKPDIDPAFAAEPRRHITVLYVVMVAVAMVVGAGIFKSPALVAENAGSTFWFFAAWVLGGVISLIGALCYAELATAFPHPGGDYYFLRLAYGRFVGFLFAWARFAVINTGSIALLGFVLGDYANHVMPLGAKGPALYALFAVLAMTAFNLKSIYTHKTADYAITGLEVGGVLIMFLAGVALVFQGTPPQTAAPEVLGPPPGSFGLALVFALLAFGGWSEVATLSSEVRDPQRGMVKALIYAILAITVLYVAANWAFWRGLGLEGLAASRAPAADLIAHAFGKWAGLITALAISLATITSINATFVVGARTTYAATHDAPRLHALGKWNTGRGIPLRALLAQSTVAVLLVGFGAQSYDGFAALVDFTAPIFWMFMILSGLGVIILRVRQPSVKRSFRVPLFPVMPLTFCAASGFMMFSSLSYVSAVYGGGGALAGFGVLAAGAVVYFLFARESVSKQVPRAPEPDASPTE